MSSQSFSPRFVKAKITLKFKDEPVQVGEHLINTEGVPGFAWEKFNAMDVAGTKVVAQVQGSSFEFNCEAFFSAEKTTKGEFLGLVFLLGDQERETLNNAIEREGQLPDYARKFPRIPFNEKISIMPSHGIIRFFHHNEDISIACEVDDFSPSGFQLSTEDLRSNTLEPGSIVRVQIQPRGEYKHAIMTNATVQRVMYRINPRSENRRWHFGLSVTTMSAEHKNHFTELLKLIVTKIKSY